MAVVLFKEIMNTDLDKVGHKALSISILANQEFNVPPGFVVSKEAFEEFLEETKLNKKIESLISKLNEENAEKISSEIKKLILNTALPKKLEEELIENYESLGFELNKLKITDLLSIKPIPLVAVRSSYIERIEDESIAQPTLLNIKGKNNLFNAIKKCWASLYDKDLILFRLKNNLSQDVSNGIVIQKMIDAEASGIAFSSNPESKKKSEILIKACFGLGEIINKIVPDSYVVNKADLSIKDTQVNEQEYAILMDHARGVIIKKSLKEKSRLQKLNNKLIEEVARVTKRISEQLKKEQMIEWCMFKERIFILQSKDLEMEFEDEKMEEPKEVEEEIKEEKTTVDIYEPPLEEDLEALEEIEAEDVDLSEKEPKIETYGEKDEESKELQKEEKDFFEFVDNVEEKREEKPQDEKTFIIDEETKEDLPTVDEIEEVKEEPQKEFKAEKLETEKDEASFDLIKDLTKKMESQLDEKDIDGYNETREKLKKTLEGL